MMYNGAYQTIDVILYLSFHFCILLLNPEEELSNVPLSFCLTLSLYASKVPTRKQKKTTMNSKHVKAIEQIVIISTTK